MSNFLRREKVVRFGLFIGQGVAPFVVGFALGGYAFDRQYQQSLQHEPPAQLRLMPATGEGTGP